MARIIVKQPNGLYACWSTSIDNFVLWDAKREDYIEWRAKEAYNDKKTELENTFNRILKSNSQIFTKDFNECIDIITKLHGEDAIPSELKPTRS